MEKHLPTRKIRATPKDDAANSSEVPSVRPGASYSLLTVLYYLAIMA